MSLRDDFVEAADELWTEFDSVTVSGTYRRTVAGAYNPATGATGATVTTVSVSVIREEWRQDQIDGTVVKVGDRIAKIRSNELGFEPSTEDQILIENSKGAGFAAGNAQLWVVKGYKTDPAGVVFDVHVRAHQ